jgi:hypothetical protein
MEVFVTLLDYFKIPQVTILGDLHVQRVLASCTTPLPPKLHALTHPPSLLANWGRLWIFDLDKSQVRGRYVWVRDIRRSHCQPFCACVLLSRSEHMLALSWSRTNYLVKIFCLLCVCFWHRRVINSNTTPSRLLQLKTEGSFMPPNSFFTVELWCCYPPVSKYCGLVSRVLAFTGQRTGSWGSRMRSQSWYIKSRIY